MEAYAKLLAEGLVLLNKLIPDEATKIRKQLLENRRAWDEEFSKGKNRDDARLDMLTRELLELGELFSSAVERASS